MTPQLRETIQQKLLEASMKILKDYTNSALLINSCHLAMERYGDKSRPVHLSTTGNIPLPLRLNMEIEEELFNDELVDRYSSETQNLIYEQYVSNSVSVIDGVFEDIYEELLKEFDPNLSEKQINDKIRAAWSQNSLIEYFIQNTGIQDSTNPQKRIKEAFDRYKEYRIIRHALMHNKGVLSDKHIRQLDEIHDDADIDSKEKTMKNSPFYESRKVLLNINIFLSFRKFLYELTGYFIQALE